MQQIRRDAFGAGARAIDRPAATVSPEITLPGIRPVKPLLPPAQGGLPVPARNRLPAPLRRRGGMLAGIGRFWVLHRGPALKGMLLLAVLTLLVSGYLLRAELASGARLAADIVTGRAAEAGLGVARISITGQALTREADVVRALGIDGFTTTLTFDAEAARVRVEEIPSIETATIRKLYPDSILVTITEKTPVARWRIDGATMLIDARGRPIAPARFENADLVLVIGEGAGDDAMAMITLMDRYPELTADLAALSRIADRRWDLIYYTGLRVQLPESGVVAALDRLNAYQRDHLLLERDLDLIDMRVPQFVAVRPTQRDDT